jgi:hypothetical protein
MAVVQIEHPVRDYAAWKAAFDSDPVHREASGVRRYQVFRPIDDPNYIAVDLEFETVPEAEAFKLAIEALWQTPPAQAALAGAPRARVVDVVETAAY